MLVRSAVDMESDANVRGFARLWVIDDNFPSYDHSFQMVFLTGPRNRFTSKAQAPSTLA